VLFTARHSVKKDVPMEQAFRVRTESWHAEHDKARPTVREPQHLVPVRLIIYFAFVFFGLGVLRPPSVAAAAGAFRGTVSRVWGIVLLS